MAALLTLRSSYHPVASAHGTIDLRLDERGVDSVERFRLALTSTVRLDPGPDGDVRLARQVSGYYELDPADDFVLRPGDAVRITDCRSTTPHVTPTTGRRARSSCSTTARRSTSTSSR